MGGEAGLGALHVLAPQQGCLEVGGPLPCRAWSGGVRPTCFWALVTSPTPSTRGAGLRPRTHWFSQPQWRLPHCSPRQAPPGSGPPNPLLAGNTNQMLGLWPVGGWKEVAVRGGPECRRPGSAQTCTGLGTRWWPGPSERKRHQARLPARAQMGRPGLGTGGLTSPGRGAQAALRASALRPSATPEPAPSRWVLSRLWSDAWEGSMPMGPAGPISHHGGFTGTHFCPVPPTA